MHTITLSSSHDDEDDPSDESEWMVALYEGERDRMIFILFSKGRNLGGIDSHVLRPMMTAFLTCPDGIVAFVQEEEEEDDGGVIVTFLKWDISAGIRHTKSPQEPMPREEAAAATTAAISVMNAADGSFSLE